MNRNTNTLTIVAAVVAMSLLASSPAAAEDYVPASSGKRFTPIRGPELRVITGLTIGVPIFLDTNSDVVRPGGDMFGWVGLDIGWMVFATGFGASWNAINLNSIEGGDQFGRSPLARLYISPEIRFQVPVAKAVLPYLSGAFDANWFRHRAVLGLTCGVWYCFERASFRFAPGFTGKIGTGIKVAERIYVDVGMKVSLSGAGDFFESTQWWVTPYVGVIYRGVAD